MKPREYIKIGSSSFFNSLGLFKFYSVIKNKQHLIMTFHRIRPAGEAHPAFDSCPCITEKTFDQILSYLMGDHKIVSLKYLYENLASKEPMAALTFDDGWRDNYTHAFPILKKYKLPATVFVTTGKIGRSEPFWQQKLGLFFQNITHSNDSKLKQFLRDDLRIKMRGKDIKRLYFSIVKYLKSFPHDEIINKLKNLPEFPQDKSHCFLNEKEIFEMSQNGIEIGSHSHSHYILSNEPFDVIENELIKSKEILENIIQKKVDVFSYPNGNYSSQVIQLVEKSGYKIACSTLQGRVGGNDHPLKLPRIDADWNDLCIKNGWLPKQIFDWVTKYKSLFAFDKLLGDKIRSTNVEGDVKKIENFDNKPVQQRIVFIMDQIYSYTGGTEQHLSFLLKELPKYNCEVYLVVLRDRGTIDLDAFPCEILNLELDSFYSIQQVVKSITRLVSFIKKRKINILHTFFQDSEFIGVVANYILKDCKLVVTRRNMGYWHTRKSLLSARILDRFISNFLVNCKAVKKQTSELEKVPAQKIHSIYNPYPLARINGPHAAVEKESLNINNDDFVVGIVANVRPVKDHTTFLKAAKIIKNKYPETKFLIVGSVAIADYKNELDELITELNIGESIIFTGEVKNPIPFIKLFDVAVLSSSSEGSSNALIEYSMIGVPTVATDVGGNSEIILDNKTGYIVPSASPDQLAKKVIELLEAPSLRSSFGESAREKAIQKFDPNTIIQNYLNYYSKLF